MRARDSWQVRESERARGRVHGCVQACSWGGWRARATVRHAQARVPRGGYQSGTALLGTEADVSQQAAAGAAAAASAALEIRRARLSVMAWPAGETARVAAFSFL